MCIINLIIDTTSTFYKHFKDSKYKNSTAQIKKACSNLLENSGFFIYFLI